MSEQRNESSAATVAPTTCSFSPVTCRCGNKHRALTTPAGVTLPPGQTEAQRRTRLLVEARTMPDAYRAMSGLGPKP